MDTGKSIYTQKGGGKKKVKDKDRNRLIMQIEKSIANLFFEQNIFSGIYFSRHNTFFTYLTFGLGNKRGCRLHYKEVVVVKLQ